MKKLYIIAIFATSISGKIFAQKDVLHISYANTPQNTLDLYLPTRYDSTTPVLIMIHGGAWMLGGNQYTEKTSEDLRNRGFIVANVDYRYVSDSVHCSDLLADIDGAVNYLQAISKKYGFAPNNYHIAGISAGAHLALLYGYTTTKKIKSITALCAPSRLDDVESLVAFAKNSLLKNLELLADVKIIQGQPLDKKLTEVSPYAHIKPIPTLLFHGDSVPLVPFAQSEFLYKQLQEKKVKSKFIPMKGKGHDVGMNEPDSEQLILGEIENWIKNNN